jgi:hypothetical protein
LRITRFPSISETQFFGCTAAFVDSLTGEVNAAALALRRLEGKSKGSAFAYEMELDRRRYGALIVLDRWSALVAAFGPFLKLSRRQTILDDAGTRVAMAETLLRQANQLIDAADRYNATIVEACILAFQALRTTFAEEHAEAAQSATLGPMLPQDYITARLIFLEDLAAR